MRRHIQSFADYLRDERGAAPATVRSYTCDLEQFAEWAQHAGVGVGRQRSKGRGWEKVTYLLLRRYLGHLARHGYDRSSVVRKLAALRSFFKWLGRRDCIAHNPAVQIVAPRLPPAAEPSLTVREVERMLELPDAATPFGLRDRALLELLYATGLRVAEAARLSPADIDWRSGEVEIGSRGGDGASVRAAPFRVAPFRVAPLGGPARRALRDYVRTARPQLLARCKSDPNAAPDALWINGRGTRLSTHAIYALVLEYARQAGIQQPVTPHTLRHACAQHLVEGGADLQVVQQLLGYRSLASTQRYAGPTTGTVRTRKDAVPAAPRK